MKPSHPKTLSLLSILLLGSSHALLACNQTISPGANLASAVSSAAAGSTICLNAGTYSAATLSGIVKSSTVTIQSTSGQTAVVSLTINNSNRLTLQNLTISKLDMWAGKNQNISVLNNKFTGQFLLVGSGKSTTAANILVDGNTFDGINVCSSCYEGRLQIYDGGGVTVSNNHFGARGESDGIQMGGYGGVIGPGNVFEDILYSGGRHVDAMQLYGEVDHHTIVGNYFRNGGSYIMAPDGGNAVTVIDNVFVAGDYYPAIQLGTHTNPTVSHNTSIGVGINIDGKSGSAGSSNAVAKDNIFLGSSFTLNCSGCTVDHNLFNTSGNVKGTGTMIGTPTFVGGSNLTARSGYQLTSTSFGYRAATDGKDMGPSDFSSGSGSLALTAPTNLRIN